jgi:putative membrane protein
MILAVLVLTNLFESHIYQVSSVFIGFILFSIPLIAKEEKESLKGKYYNIIFMIIGILIVALITYFNPISGESNVVDISNLNFGLALYIFVAAMIAISAMVLPGISGSTLLLIFGLYIPIISAIKEFLHLNFSYLPALIVFGLGVIFGIILVIRLIKIALKKYRSQSIYCILGLMIGSIYAIIMGPTTLDATTAPLSFSTFSILAFLLGGVIILGLEKVKVILKKKKIQED